MKKHFMLLLLAVLSLCTALQARTIYVTRHGQVEPKNKQLSFTTASGARDIKLTDLGREQAKLLGGYLVKRKKFKGTIYVSPFYRTTETGIIIADMIGKKVLLEPGIQEIAGGKKGKVMTGAEINELFKGKAVPGSAFTDDWRIGGENNEARQLRVEKAIDRIIKESKGDVLLVSHGGTVSDIVKAFNKKLAPGVKPLKGTVWNCSLFRFELNDENKVVKSKYTTKYMPDEKVTSNFRVPKIPRPDDPRYDQPKAKAKAKTKAKRPVVTNPNRMPGERLILITRHCQQTGGANNPEYIRPFPFDSGITKLGIKQATNLGKALKKLNFKGKIYSSPYFRCVATGSYAAKECGSKVYPDIRVQQKSRGNKGNLKKTAKLSDYRKLFPDQIAPEAKLVDNWLIQKKESTADQLVRTKAALKALMDENPGEDIMIVSHGSGVQAYYININGVKPDKEEFIWNCALFKFAADKDGNLRYLGYDISFMSENEEEVTSNLQSTLKQYRESVAKKQKPKVKSGVDYEY